MATGKPEDQGGSDGPLSDWTASHAATTRPLEAGRGFTPGTMLAGRYRIVALVGKGGFGEVYRADDTKLGQAVALKFFRGALSLDLLERLYAEVRIGRQVSHPNVCRLHDIVEVEGQTFLAMEYVDGEDLASLLARIGRLSPDKAIDVARDLCAALAAVHDKGIVHRDLKPANVLIDGRGRARLTDFGLAIGLEAPEPGQVAGTPAYMAPEQLTGGEITFRSDLYALGLILYEMFTGRRFFEAKSLADLTVQHAEAKLPRMTSASGLLDPAVERAILRCLEEDPTSRPASARALIASLPGGDPLEAALAAGETPSPEMVAVAGQVGDLDRVTAWSLLLAVAFGLLASAYLTDTTTLVGKASFPKPPEALVERAHEVLTRLGYVEPPADTAQSFVWDPAYLRYVASHDPSPRRWDKLRGARLGPYQFWYRTSPRPLVAANRDGVVTRNDPPAEVSGMTQVVLETDGRLGGFLAVPSQLETSAGPWPEPDFSALFHAADLDPGALRPVEPRWAASVDSDRKAAWEGVYPGDPGVPVRIEAAAYHGRPVWFEVLPPWAQPSRMRELSEQTSRAPIAGAGIWLLALAMPLGGIVLARYNLRMGRGDQKGSFRVALFVFAAYSLARLTRADHVAVASEELWILIKVLAYPSFWALQVWLLYMALEPYARRRWPHMLISWKRLLAGRVRDPLVGRDILMGCVAGAAVRILFGLTVMAPAWSGKPPLTPDILVYGATLASVRDAGFRLLVNQYSAVLYALAFVFLLVLLRSLLRVQWLAVVLWCVVVGSPLRGEELVVEWAMGGLKALVFLLALTRGGLLSVAVALYVSFIVVEAPLTLDLSAWYASRALPTVLVVVGLALYGFVTSLAGKSLLGQSLLED